MDLGDPQLLENILTGEDLEQTPPQVQEKLKKYLDGFFDEYCKEKAAANRLHDYELKTEVLTSQIEDYEVKLQNYAQNVDELRTQLDSVSGERTQLLQTANANEKFLATLRLERNTVADERDSLLKVIERQNSELERQQQEVRSYQQQLRSAIMAKCEAIARVDEIESKEVALNSKERRMEQERNMLHNQVQTLSDDLNRNIAELQNIRRDNTTQNMQVEARLHEKTEELKIAQTQCGQYKETIERLTQNVQELSTKLLQQNEESNKMMDFYKTELDAKTKLSDLYRSNCDDTDVERSELCAAIADLKRMLAEASDQYGDLETKFKATTLQHEQQLEDKDKQIESQMAEIRHANDLLKEVQRETTESAISKLAPSAAVASRLIRSDMSLTELYSLYVKSSEELELQKRENSRLHLQLKTILHELNENAPAIKKQELDYEKLVETNNILAHQRDELLGKKSDMEELLVNAHSKISHVERENKKLKHSQSDLSRQVCYLLKEVEQLRIGLIADNNAAHCGSGAGSLSTTDEVISKKLVTFSNIPELQENNQKLLLLVRDLSTKLEESETLKQKIDESSYHEKIEGYVKKFQNMQETLNQQNNTVATLVSKCERYKRMYFELQKQVNKTQATADLSDEDCEMTEGGGGGDAHSKTRAVSSLSTTSPVLPEPNSERRIRDLEQQLDEIKSQYKTLKEQHEYYSQEKKNNEKILNEQFDSMRSEVRGLTSTNCKLMSSFEYTKEQIKLQQKNIATYKQQIVALEDRNKNYENTIVKHEQTVHYLKDEIMKTQRGHSAAESETNHLRHENRLLKDSAARLQSEKDGYHREHQNQNLLLSNLEMIKSNLERSEMEGRARLEQRLDETYRELSAQRRRFQEEEDRFRETTNDLKRQADTARINMEEEKKQADKLRTELIGIREELGAKSDQIDELSKKLQESLTPAKNDNPIVAANKKAREFELKFEEAKIELSSLTTELTKAREHADQYFKMSQSAETEIKSLHEVYTTFVGKAETEIKQLKLSELNLKSRITELESEMQLILVADISSANLPADQLKKSQDELKDALQKLSECNRNLRALRSDNTTLSEALNAVETKYANEMVLHSADIQDLTKMKTELAKVQDQINDLTTDRDSAKAAHLELKSSLDETYRLQQNERDELEKRLTDLNSLNSHLHDQIEALTTKMSILSQTQTSANASTSGNESIMEMSATDLNRSHVADEDAKSSDQLLQIIKFLRKEKDLTMAKLDILKAENTRLMSEHTIQQKKIDELNGFLNQERAKSETIVASTSKHEEILRKIETLNAITDSNRILREERNALANRVKELNERISNVEDELFPLQNQNRELSSKIEELSTENTSLRTEAIKWRQRANILVEKSNKNPEEFKRLQMERENLAKMLTSEKELLRQATDELNAFKTDKARIEAELASIEKQLQLLAEEKKKFSDDLGTVKQSNSRLMQEIMELKNKLLQKEDAVQKLAEDLKAKELQLQDSKNKEIQIRKIAKRYKDSFLELSNKTAATAGGGDGTSSQDNIELGGGSTNTGVAESGAVDNATSAASSAELEQQRVTIESLNGLIRTMQEDNEKLRKDYDVLKTSAEIDEQTKALLRDAKSSIIKITDSRNSMSQELTNTKTKLQSFVQAAENHDAAISAIKGEYEETIARMEKEMLEQSSLNKEAIARLTRENESLLMRINQLSRQLGQQQSAKPSTSSVSAITDKGISESSSPRTANVKPMSGSSTAQQSATVTPWRGGETPLASIRPISVQNSRTAAILPTSQQQQQTGAAAVGGGSSSTTSTSSSSVAAASSANNTPSSASCSNTALVPPQQQVHTTGSSSVVESMASSSPTSSHTDYMPSTSSASVAVAAIPPMGSASAAVAESSQEAESMQQPQQNDAQQLVSGGGGGSQQVVALVSPRVEGSSQNASPSPNTLPHAAGGQDPNQNQQPSTSGTTSSTSHIAVSSHSRHTPSSSNVTTTQAGSSGSGGGGGHKRPRGDLEGDSSTSVDDPSSGAEKNSKHPKRMRTPLHGSESTILLGVTDSGIDVEYQVPTSSQRDQEDDIVVVDSEEDDGMAEAEADDGPVDDDDEADEHEGYEDSYEQDQDMDENECPEANESNIQPDVVVETTEVDNNEVDVDESMVENQVVQCTSGISDDQADVASYSGSGGGVVSGASTSQAAAAAAAAALAHSQQQDNNQQSQAISSGSYEPKNPNIPQSGTSPWKQASSATSTFPRQQKAANQGNEQDASGSRRSDSSTEIVSSPQGSKFGYMETTVHSDENESKAVVDNAVDESVETGEDFISEDYTQKKDDETTSEEGGNKTSAGATSANVEDSEDADEEFPEEVAASIEASENADSESHHSSGATQSEIQDIQQSQLEVTSEDNEGVDGVSSEGEKQAVEEMEEEGREAEATTSPSINTRSKTTRGGTPSRRPSRGYQRGGRPTPIIWQESPGNSRNAAQQQQQQQHLHQHRNPEQPGSPGRGFPNQRTQRARRMRRPSGGNFPNMRYS